MYNFQLTFLFKKIHIKDKIMGIESGFDIARKLIACPFDHVCHLPKHHFLCKIPECKMCPDYISHVLKLKSRISFTNY